MKQQKYPLLATLFYQYGLEGACFQGDWFAVLLNRIFMPALIPCSIPSVPVVIHPVISSLVYLVPFAPEFVTV